MQGFQTGLVNAWTDYVAGKIDAKALKGASAGFGIYQQRNDLTMLRVRRTGGIITAAELKTAASLLRTHNGAFAHLTTRQDIQLHDVPATDVVTALADCEAKGFHFRGGGGDTFRNTLTSAYSGLHADSVFDVVPYAKALSEYFYHSDVPYGLPRKYKIGFADRPAERWLAQTQDLGFVAKIVDGQRVFEVYLGGGIGFKPRVGFKLYEALPTADTLRVALALGKLFKEKGCRDNRSHARIRFLREDFGDEGLAALFREYLATCGDVPDLVPSPSAEIPETTFSVNAAAAAGFDAWKEIAVTPLTNGRVAVRLFVPFGNMTAAQLDALADVMTPFNATRFEILTTLDLGLIVPADQLAGLHAALLRHAAVQDLLAHSFLGNIRTCIGCMICKSGVTDSPAIGRAVAAWFDKYQPLDTPKKIAIAKILLNEVRISGCPNSCTNQQLSQFGFAGRKLNGADAETTYTAGVLAPEPILGQPDKTVLPITRDDFPAALEARILASIA